MFLGLVLVLPLPNFSLSGARGVVVCGAGAVTLFSLARAA